MAEEDDRRPGRPPAEEPTTVLGVRVTVREFDQLCQIAQRQEQSLSAVVRRILRERLKP